MIFYFSGTGNTKWVAQQLAEATHERLLFIPTELKSNCRYQLAEGERIGFCFPTHGWQPPAVVRQFVRRMKITAAEGHYCYAVTTCGDNMGEAMTIFNRELKQHALSLDSSFAVLMPESYVCLPFMNTDNKQREREKIENARQTITHISEVISLRTPGIHQLIKGAVPRIYSYVIGAFFNQKMITDKPFHVDEEKCIGCGLCQKVCPMEDIVLKERKNIEKQEQGKPIPEWIGDGRCTCCLNCYHHCPQHAINYGRRTQRKGQYFFKPEDND